MLERHHYLGAPPLVGANLKYLVYGRTGQLLGALGWQSAVQHLGCRDRLLGWNAAQRAHWLDRVVNGGRFLVLPWVTVRDWARGFAKRQGRFVHHGQSKEVYVYVMESRMRQFIHGDACQPLLNCVCKAC